MSKDQIMGSIVLICGILGIVLYFYLMFLSAWTFLIIQLSAFIAVAALFVITAWIGYTLATTPPPQPIDASDVTVEENESKGSDNNE